MSTKKNKPSQDDYLKAEQEKLLREKAIAEEYKNKMRPFVKFLKNKQLRFHHARVGQSRIEYFRLDQFDKLLATHAQQLQADEDLKNKAKTIREELIYFKRPSNLKAKYPDRLQPVAPESSQKKYACFRFDTTESKKWMMWGVIFTVLSLVLFPVWPFQLKYAVWLISFYLLIFLVGLIVLRLFVYVVCVMFGYNVWILPNLLGDSGFWDSFRPFILYERWEKNLYNTLIRVFVVSSLIAYACYLYLNPGVFYENISLTNQTINDIHDWGVQKIKNQKNFSQRAITNLEVILNQTADANDSAHTQQTLHPETQQQL